MAKTDNLREFLTDVANAIRNKKGTTDLINPQDFSTEIESIQGGGGTGERDPHETLSVLKTYDFVRFDNGEMLYFDLPSEQDYENDEVYVNDTIKEITGVDFNA